MKMRDIRRLSVPQLDSVSRIALESYCPSQGRSGSIQSGVPWPPKQRSTPNRRNRQWLRFGRKFRQAGGDVEIVGVGGRPPPDVVDQDCNLHNGFPAPLRKTVEQMFDAVLYLGPQDLRLWEKTPADILLDSAYMNERRRREALPGGPARSAPVSAGSDRDIVARAADPLFRIDTPPPASQAAIEGAVRDCQERKRQAPPK